MVNVPIEPILIKVNFAILNRFEIFFYWMHHINWTMPIVTWLVGSHIYFGFCQPTLAVLVWWLCCGLRATARYSPINGQYYPHIEIGQLICIFFANRLTVFYIMGTKQWSLMDEIAVRPAIDKCSFWGASVVKKISSYITRTHFSRKYFITFTVILLIHVYL